MQGRFFLKLTIRSFKWAKSYPFEFWFWDKRSETFFSTSLELCNSFFREREFHIWEAFGSLLSPHSQLKESSVLWEFSCGEQELLTYATPNECWMLHSFSQSFWFLSLSNTHTTRTISEVYWIETLSINTLKNTLDSVYISLLCLVSFLLLVWF